MLADVPLTAEGVLPLAIKLAIDEGDDERASVLLTVARRQYAQGPPETRRDHRRNTFEGWRAPHYGRAESGRPPIAGVGDGYHTISGPTKRESSS